MTVPFWLPFDETAGCEGPLYAPDPWDSVTIGGYVLPGRSTVQAGPTNQIDVQKASGRDGATLILRGYLPGPIDIDTLIWTPEQWETYQVIIADLWAKPGKIASSDRKNSATGAEAAFTERASLAIDHPGLSIFGVTRVVIIGVAPPTESSEAPGARICKLRCHEFVPTPEIETTKRVKGSSSDLIGDGAVTERVQPDFQTPANVANVPPSSPSKDTDP